MIIFVCFYGPYQTYVMDIDVPPAVVTVLDLRDFLVGGCDQTRRLHLYADVAQLRVMTFEDVELEGNTDLAQFFLDNENSTNHHMKILVPESPG